LILNEQLSCGLNRRCTITRGALSSHFVLVLNPQSEVVSYLVKITSFMIKILQKIFLIKLLYLTSLLLSCNSKLETNEIIELKINESVQKLTDDELLEISHGFFIFASWLITQIVL
jgi:hypothetical protein